MSCTCVCVHSSTRTSQSLNVTQSPVVSALLWKVECHFQPAWSAGAVSAYSAGAGADDYCPGAALKAVCCRDETPCWPTAAVLSQAGSSGCSVFLLRASCYSSFQLVFYRSAALSSIKPPTSLIISTLHVCSRLLMSRTNCGSASLDSFPGLSKFQALMT